MADFVDFVFGASWTPVISMNPILMRPSKCIKCIQFANGFIRAISPAKPDNIPGDGFELASSHIILTITRDQKVLNF